MIAKFCENCCQQLFRLLQLNKVFRHGPECCFINMHLLIQYISDGSQMKSLLRLE